MTCVHGIYRRPRNRSLRTLLIAVVGITVFAYLTCNYGVYYAIAMQCDWPAVAAGGDGVVRVMLLADLHLLGNKNVDTMQKVRSEWKMRRAYQAAAYWHQPEAVFILGDIFEKGATVSDEEFKQNVEDFQYIFSKPEDITPYVVPGNKDIGYHGGLINEKAKRFEEQLKSPPVRLVTIRGVHFVLINSMAMEGDGCMLCARAANKIQHISETLRCAAGNQFCKMYPKPDLNYSSPILIQHFPLYRDSDVGCVEVEVAQKPEQDIFYKERRDCLSKESSLYLIEKLRPRAVFGAHLHRACRVSHQFQADVNHKYDMLEVTLPTFSWRNHARSPPAYYLLATQPKGPILVTKCILRDFNLPEFIVLVLLTVCFYYSYCRPALWIEARRIHSHTICTEKRPRVHRHSLY